MTRTARIEELLRIRAERPWTDAELAEVEAVTIWTDADQQEVRMGDDERRSQFEIEGEYSHEGGKPGAYDRRMPVEDVRAAREDLVMPKDASPLPTSQPDDIQIRLAQLEATTTELFAKLKALEARLIRDGA